MIFPFLKGIVSYSQAPVTWLIVLLNASVLFWGWTQELRGADELDDLMNDDFFVETQGKLYDRYLKDGHFEGESVARDVSSISDGDRGRLRLLGHLAFRDENFLRSHPEKNGLNDRVALKHWLSQSRKISALEKDHPSFVLGVSIDPTNWSQWLTYIFSHTNFYHFLGNMVFLIIFGGALETAIGGLGLIVVFLMSGIFAAGFFLWLCGPSTAPLVGASGAISGIMAMYSVLNWNRPIRFLYLFIPTTKLKGFISLPIGFIFLPAGVGFLLWMLGDLAGFFGSIEIFGGVAHAAHLGGDIAGIVAGLLVLGIRRIQGEAWPDDSPRHNTWQLYPLFENNSTRVGR